MKVLLTGVTGRVGSSLALHLMRLGYDVRGMLRPGSDRSILEPLPEIEIVEASLTDYDAMERAVKGVEAVVHMAAQIPMRDTPVQDYFDINFGGTLRLLEAAVSQRQPVRRFVFGSTDNTYGPTDPQEGQITEDHPQVPGDYYSTSKVLCERLIENYQKLHGLEYVILRLGSILAPNEAPAWFRLDWVRAFLAAHAAAGRRSNLWQLFKGHENPLRVLDRQTASRDDNPAVALVGPDGLPWSLHLTDVRDVVSGVLLSMTRSAAANSTFNIVGPTTTSFTSAASVLSDRTEIDRISVSMPMKLAFELSWEKARAHLGYVPEWDFARMVDAGLHFDGLVEDYVPVR